MNLLLWAREKDPVAAKIKRLLAAKPKVAYSQVDTPKKARDSVAQALPDVLLIGPSISSENALAFAEVLLTDHPEVGVVLATKEMTTEVLKASLNAGIRDVLKNDVDEDDLYAAINKAHEVSKRWRGAAGGDLETAERREHRAKVVTVFSTKGGVGKSVIATNLATTIASKLGKRTVLIDLDLQFGDVAVMLRLVQDRTIADVVRVFDRLDEEMLDSFLAKHDSGIKALLAPVQPEDADIITIDEVERIIGLLKSWADYIIIDTAPALSETVLAALEASDIIYAVTTMDVPSIRNTKISLQKLKQLNYDQDKVRLVLNRSDSKVLLQPGEIEKVLDSRIVARIPSDRSVPRSVNKGIPVVSDASKSLVARSLTKLAEETVNGWKEEK